MRFDYKVLPAPGRGGKRGDGGAEMRFAAAVEEIMNDMAREGWEYLRSETLPSEERSGLTQTATVWRNLLVFRRPAAEDVSAFRPKMLEAPSDSRPPEVAAEAAAPKARRVEVRSAASTGPAKSPDDEEDAPRPSIEVLPGALMARAARVKRTDD